MIRPKSLVHVSREHTKPMDPEQDSPFFVRLMFQEMEMAKAKTNLLAHAELEAYLTEIDPDIMNDFFMKVAMKRLEHARNDQGEPMKFSPNVLLFVIATQTPNIATAVMWAYTIAEETRLHGSFSMEELAHGFPVGFPTDAGYHEHWVAQKGHSLGEKFDNWLDRTEAWAPQGAEA